MKRSHSHRWLATLGIGALIVGGCANPVANTDTDDTTSQDTAAVTAATTTPSPREQGVAFAECMRDNGVGDFPDPDASGSLSIDGVVNGTSLDPDSAAFQNALVACKDLEPPGFMGFERTPEQQLGAIEFARCMRDNGVPDFPDPGVNDPLVDTNRIPSTAREGGMDILNAAMGECGDLASAAGVTEGE
jgi:hypothetical protein